MSEIESWLFQFWSEIIFKKILRIKDKWAITFETFVYTDEQILSFVTNFVTNPHVF